MSIGYFRQWNSLGPLLPDLRGTTTPARSPPSKAHWPRSRPADPDWSNPGRKLDENTCNWSGALVGSVLADGRLPHPHARRSNRVQLPRDAACPCHSAARKLHERPSHLWRVHVGPHFAGGVRAACRRRRSRTLRCAPAPRRSRAGKGAVHFARRLLSSIEAEIPVSTGGVGRIGVEAARGV